MFIYIYQNKILLLQTTINLYYGILNENSNPCRQYSNHNLIVAREVLPKMQFHWCVPSARVCGSESGNVILSHVSEEKYEQKTFFLPRTWSRRTLAPRAPIRKIHDGWKSSVDISLALDFQEGGGDRLLGFPCFTGICKPSKWRIPLLTVSSRKFTRSCWEEGSLKNERFSPMEFTMNLSQARKAFTLAPSSHLREKNV